MNESWIVPGATAEYEAARRQLVHEEQHLRDHIERVAAMRRALPPGPIIADY